MSLLAVKLGKKIKAAKVSKIKVKRKIPTRALPLFFECNMERPFVASDILRTLGQKTPIAKNYVLSGPIPLKNRFFGTQYVSSPLMDRNLQFFSSYDNFRFGHSPTLPLIRNRQLSIFSALSSAASFWRCIFIFILLFIVICVQALSVS